MRGVRSGYRGTIAGQRRRPAAGFCGLFRASRPGPWVPTCSHRVRIPVETQAAGGKEWLCWGWGWEAEPRLNQTGPMWEPSADSGNGDLGLGQEPEGDLEYRTAGPGPLGQPSLVGA